MRFYSKPDNPKHVRKRIFAFLPRFLSDNGENGMWVWLEWLDELEDSYGDTYYRLPLEDRCQGG